jgi:CheY-like chemotaxis protein
MLPRQGAEASAGSRIAFPPAPSQRLNTPPVNPATKPILLLDDEKSYTDLLTQMLADHFDCRVIAYTRPLDALRALPTIEPAVVVTDYYMPQLNGIEFIRQAAPLVPDAAFVMITGHNLTAEQEQLDRLSPLKGFLAKPFSWRKLADEIQRVWPAHLPAPQVRSEV